MTESRFMVTGSRDWTDTGRIAQVLLHHCQPGDTLVVGEARGADQIAQRVWREHGPVEEHRAKWDEFGKRAGFVRNQEMADSGVSTCFAFVMPCRKPEHLGRPRHDSHGARHAYTVASRNGAAVHIYRGW